MISICFRSTTVLLTLGLLACLGCRKNPPEPGKVLDEAKRAGKGS